MSGNIALLKIYLEANHACPPPSSMPLAAKSGHFDLLRYVHKERLLQRYRYPPMRADILEIAARTGDADLVFTLMDEGFPCDCSVYAGAAAGGHLDLMQRILDERKISVSGNESLSILTAGVRLGRKDIVLWGIQNGARLVRRRLLISTKSEEMKQWIRETFPEDGFVEWRTYTSPQGLVFSLGPGVMEN